MSDSLLSPFQKEVLEAIFGARLGERGYYLTSGTALSEFYLKHRYSDDLDLFTRKAAVDVDDLSLVEEVCNGLNIEVIRRPTVTPPIQHTPFFLGRIGGSDSLKVEFGRDAGPRMAPPIERGSVVVDSLEDIAVNRVCAILGRDEPKDFWDLYLILCDTTFSLDYLLVRAREKDTALEGDEGVLQFAAALLKARDLPMLPRMVRAITLEQLRGLLVPEAQKLIRSLRPG